jgi:formylglycine-generating enzyme required for sulfatase activity
LLGPPGSGKTSLLQRLALDTAIEALRDEAGGGTVPFLVSLSTYASTRRVDALPEPMAWLSRQWSARYPDLPSLASLIDEGRLLLLLDGLNEIRAVTADDWRRAVARWRRFATQAAARHAGNRIVFSSRSLDLSQPLSTASLRVPHIRIEPLSNGQVRRYLEHQIPEVGEETWRRLRGTPALELLRTPIFLTLYVTEMRAGGRPVAGGAALLTAFVRRALEREVPRGHAFLAAGALLTEADLLQLRTGVWPNDFSLPDRGLLARHLTRLAYDLQRAHDAFATRQVRIDYGEALDLIGEPYAEMIVNAGAAILVLEHDTVSGELMFAHQLMQEYFAARQLAQAPEPELARSEWRADRVEPPLRVMIEGLAPADALPPLPATGWDGTMRLAAVMAEDPDRFVGRLMDANLPLAGRCAAQSELRDRLSAEVLDALRQALVARSRDETADLRARIACGDVLGALGDPRFEPRVGAFDHHVLPPLVELPAGDYVLGADAPFRAYNQRQDAHLPRHEIALPAFAIGRFAVTNAEWACFMDAGGYTDERWWDTRAGQAWRRGEGTAYGIRFGVRYWWERFRSEPRLLEQRRESGVFDDDLYARWRARIAMPEAELAPDLAQRFPDRRHTEPRYWRDERYNRPSQPVVGVCWFEARAYCAWLAAQTGLPFRLPTEAEWEAATGGPEGHARAAAGDSRSALDCNTVEAHVRRPSPVGVFPASDSPVGVSDLSGNTWDWTSSAWGEDPDTPAFGYPYATTDGREDVDVSAHVRRVARGGSWYRERGDARATFRFNLTPDMWSFDRGLRVALSLDQAPSMGGPT